MNWRSGNFLLAAALVLLEGCSGYEYAMKTYGDTDPVNFTSQGKVWRVFDKPNDGIMMITPSLSDTAEASIAEGLTLGAIGNQTAPVPHFRKAASDYLKATGRTCTVTSTREVVDPQWEFTYDCAS